MGKITCSVCILVIILVGLTTTNGDISSATEKNTTTIAENNPFADLIINESNNDNGSPAGLSRVKRQYPYYYDPYYRYPYPVPIIVGVGGIGVPFGYGRGFGVRGFGGRGFGGRGFGGRGIGGRGIGGRGIGGRGIGGRGGGIGGGRGGRG